MRSPLTGSTRRLKSNIALLLVCSAGGLLAQADADLKTMSAARQKRTEILSQRHDMNDERVRGEVVRQLQAADAAREAAVRRRAQARNLPLEGDRPGRGRFALVDFDENDQPVYHQTENGNAAISTAANLVRSTAPYNVTGAGVKIGHWEAGGIPRQTHQEFAGRISIADGATTVTDHATHVAGTLAAAGVNPAVLGMAPAATLVCYNSTSDTTEMTAVGASAPNTTKIYLSNHSYGARAGWEDNVWYGAFTDDANPANDVEADFGRYSTTSVSFDGLAYNLPYYLVFISAGNHRNDTPPGTGTTWTYAANSSTYSYDPAQHPKGDGVYKSGYDTIEGNKLAKNIIAIGAVNDAVSGGVRSIANGTMASFSAWGPADDGRIKPDVMANGVSLVSSGGISDTDIYSSSGTSMSSPNACGSAALLIQYYTSRFPSGAMRASTLKNLIIHTADDLGTAGPDYKNGWGLMNTKAAADVIKQHADNTGGAAIVESSVSTSSTSRTFTNSWDGTKPLRVTLGWTDPAGTSKSGNDNRTKALVNDLNLTVTRVGGTTSYPYVMPYVGDWTSATIGSAAITGVNTVDNTEQVYLAAPTAGEYIITVNYTGTLTGGLQGFSLIVSGETAPWVNGPNITGDNYTETFDGTGAPLNGKPTTTGGGTWIANSIVTDKGDCTTSAGSAVLPFDPVPNRIYTVSMDFNHISTGVSWTGLGFCSAPPAAALGGNSNSDRFSNNPTGYAWMLYNDSHQIVTYEGPKAGTTTNGGGGPYANSIHTLSVVLDTTGDGSTFTADYLIDGASITGGPKLIDAVTVAGINYVGFSQTTLSSGSKVDNFSLTSRPAGTYGTWATANGIAGEPATGDFDQDGLANLVEYALGLNPTTATPSPGSIDAGILSFNKGTAAVTNGDVTFTIEESDDLGVTDPWAEVTPTVNDTSKISYELPSGPGQPAVFARLRIVQTP